MGRSQEKLRPLCDNSLLKKEKTKVHKVLFECFDAPVNSYAFFMAMSFTIGSLYLAFLNRLRADSPIITPLIGIWVFMVSLPGARLFYAIQYGLPFSSTFNPFRGGLVFYGGMFGGILSIALYSAVWRIPFLYLVDLVSAATTLGEAIARLGCFLNGCCWGNISTMPWAIRFPAGSPAWRQQVCSGFISSTNRTSLPVHPTQLYLALGMMIIAAILFVVFIKKKTHGLACASYFILYPLLRFPVEYLRGDTTFEFFGLSVSQTISLVLFVVGVYSIIVLKRKNAKEMLA